MNHVATWRSPQPFWRTRLLDRQSEAFSRPDILRFASDEFMEQVGEALAQDVDALRNFVVEHEERDDPAGPYRLYLPAHQRYYLVCASLVCRVRGLPERRIDVAGGETAGFVLRRQVGATEQGWFGESGWRSVVKDELGTHDGTTEEQLPLFWMSFDDPAAGVTRRVALGMIPVGAREKYEGGVDPATESTDLSLVTLDDADDPRRSRFVQSVEKALDALRLATGDREPPVEVVRESYAIALLDLLQFFRDEFDELYRWVTETGEVTTGSLLPIRDALDVTVVDHLREVAGQEEQLLGLRGESADLPEIGVSTASDIRGRITLLVLRGFFANVKAFLPEGEEDLRRVVGERVVPTTAAGSTYVARCVYGRPNCALHSAPVLSEATVPFQFASFYDPNLEMREIRMTMPIDTSVQGIRKAGRQFKVQMSSALRRQVERFTGKDEFDGSPGQDNSFDLGVICSFSIPIITICALILLMIIVSILNIVFFWIPLLRICFPLRLSAK